MNVKKHWHIKNTAYPHTQFKAGVLLTPALNDSTNISTTAPALNPAARG